MRFVNQLESGTSPGELSKEIQWVSEAASKTENSYVIALGANVTALGGNRDVTSQLLDKLSGLQAGDGSVKGGVVSVVGSGGEVDDAHVNNLFGPCQYQLCHFALGAPQLLELATNFFQYWSSYQGHGQPPSLS